MHAWQKEDLEAGKALARQLFDTLARETADPPGVTRVAFGEGERIAHDLLIGEAEARGFETVHDAAGNLFLTQPGEDRSGVIYIGSHVDSVPHGGNYDGAAGVIAGLAAQAVFHAAGRKPPFDLVVLALRAEESCWFPHSYIGSKTALGIFDGTLLDTLRRSDNGRTLADHMREGGFDPDAVGRGDSRIDRKRTVAYIEPHIEQAPVLVFEDLPVGIVTGIRGSFRYRAAKCVGAYAHSGAMPREYRKDAVAATAELVTRMDDLWAKMLDQGKDLTVTFGEMMTNPEQHGFSKVAGEVHFCIDVRSNDRNTLDVVREELLTIADNIAERRQIRFDFGELSNSTPAIMSDSLQELMAEAAKKAGVPYHVMASGAGHDAATFALEDIPSAMLFIRNQNGSHNADEAMDMADFDEALAVLVHMLSMPAKHWRD